MPDSQISRGPSGVIVREEPVAVALFVHTPFR
jgi:hypothetical protein